MDSVIEALQNTPQYTVTEVGADGEKQITIDHYRAINSKHDEASVVSEIATADIVTCAVGPNILKFIAPLIARGIEARSLDYPLAVVACENAINATTTLANFIKERLSPETLAVIDDKARFANSAVDRIVPQQEQNAGLNIKIETFHEWCVELPPFAGMAHPHIEGVHFVEDLSPYIERKLYTVNTSHATAAYYGYAAGKHYIHEAMADPAILAQVRGALGETSKLITTKYDITPEAQAEYVELIVSRISNPVLRDSIERVGRAPLRKLSRKERFIGPASQLAELGLGVEHLMGSVEKAFGFQNVPGDDESKELARLVQTLSAEEAVGQICGLEPSHPLWGRVVEVVGRVKESGAGAAAGGTPPG